MAGPGSLVCAPAGTQAADLQAQQQADASSLSGPDLLVRYDNSSAAASAGGTAPDGSTTLLVIVQCVHKGALACRRNSGDGTAASDTLGRCVIAVRVPPQEQAADGNGALPPCSVTPGFRCARGRRWTTVCVLPLWQASARLGPTPSHARVRPIVARAGT